MCEGDENMSHSPAGVTSPVRARYKTLVEADGGERILGVQAVAQSLPGKKWGHRSPNECPIVWRE